MNPDDPNQNQGGGQTGSVGDTSTVDQSAGSMGTPEPQAPAMGAGDQPAPVSEPTQASSQTQPDATSEPTTSENCHCGKPVVVGNCSGCNLPTASCTCAPAAV